MSVSMMAASAGVESAPSEPIYVNSGASLSAGTGKVAVDVPAPSVVAMTKKKPVPNPRKSLLFQPIVENVVTGDGYLNLTAQTATPLAGRILPSPPPRPPVLREPSPLQDSTNLSISPRPVRTSSFFIGSSCFSALIQLFFCFDPVPFLL